MSCKLTDTNLGNATTLAEYGLAVHIDNPVILGSAFLISWATSFLLRFIHNQAVHVASMTASVSPNPSIRTRYFGPGTLL